ncbi:protein NRT1/ PTR FAMILY 8.3-like [Camellia sinensis]|uniref:protein NRT1/ PTR FAMILY 8.3-like n=1 Tax=Camellia sinensis TaxID=4442 RepID=UPI001036108F|nr:protein NRT1/ PTR FAMILY 8.3-like [Camellia sinensis]
MACIAIREWEMLGTLGEFDLHLGEFVESAALFAIVAQPTLVNRVMETQKRDLEVPVYDRVIVPIARKFTGREKGFTELQRMGIGLFISVLCMVSAALVEMKRLALAQALGLVDENVPMPLSITWQIPQYFLFGAAEVFTFIGQLEFFYVQSLNDMCSLFAALSLLTTSMGSYLSSFILTVVTSRSTETGRRTMAKGWDLGVGEDLEAFVHLVAGAGRSFHLAEDAHLRRDGQHALQAVVEIRELLYQAFQVAHREDRLYYGHYGVHTSAAALDT